MIYLNTRRHISLSQKGLKFEEKFLISVHEFGQFKTTDAQNSLDVGSLCKGLKEKFNGLKVVNLIILLCTFF